MTSIVIVSDSHGNVSGLERLMPIFAENDYVIHLGDGAADMKNFAAKYPEKLRRVSGNCDFYAVEDEGVLEAEGHRIFYCHGHKYGVKSSKERLVHRAKELGCDVALYGHTHDECIETIDGVLTINPGCMTRYAAYPTYCYLCIHGEKVVATIVEARRN
ncbi:MAG: YfcE family phosphodiesterase [Christensenellaceae bacterium]